MSSGGSSAPAEDGGTGADPSAFGMHDTASSFLVFSTVYAFVTFLLVVPRFFCRADGSRRRLRQVSLLTDAADESPDEGVFHQGAPLHHSRQDNEDDIELTTRADEDLDKGAEEPRLESRFADAAASQTGITEETRVGGNPTESQTSLIDISFHLVWRNQKSGSSEAQSAATTSRLQSTLQRTVASDPLLDKFNLRSVVNETLYRFSRSQQSYHHNFSQSWRPSARQRRRARTLSSSNQIPPFDERQTAVASGREDSTSSRKDQLFSKGPRSMISSVASSVLQDEAVEGECDYYWNRHVQDSHRRRRSSNSHSETSILPGLPLDAVSPEDAADAADPGRSNPFLIQSDRKGNYWWEGPCAARCGECCEVMEPDHDTWLILQAAVPSTAFSIVDPFFRVVLISVISYFVDAQSSIAFVLVTLFIQLTSEEISSSIIDVETYMIQDILTAGGENSLARVGSHMQLALFMQTLVLLPILLMWAYVMESFVNWLSLDTAPDVAALAQDYTRIIVADYLVRALSRTFMVPFGMDMNPAFDRFVDVIGTAVTLIVIIIVLRLDQALSGVSSLFAVGMIQVIASIVKAVIKIVCLVYQKTLVPYQKGLLGPCTFLTFKNVYAYFVAGAPLFIGSLFELREWPLLTLFLRALGPMEVAAWAVMGALWELLEILAASLGDAGGSRVGIYLDQKQPEYAEKLSRKVVFLGIIQVLLVSSAFLMIGPNISVLLTESVVLQNLLNDLVPMTALANFAMSLAQLYWSLVGAQGRFLLASAPIIACRWLIVLPLAAACVFGYAYGLDAVAGCIALGYATAAAGLAVLLLRTDWTQVAMTESFAAASPEGMGLENALREGSRNDEGGGGGVYLDDCVDDDDEDGSEESPIL